MSDVLPPLVLAIRANAGQVKTALAGVGNDVAALDKKTEGGLSKSSKAFNGLAGVGKAALFGIAGAGLAVGAMSLKLGVGFQEATTQLVTGAGESEQNIGMIRKGLLDMAPAVGMGPEALAKAMFLVESAGYHGADGLKVMKAAAEGAKIGGADATVVANGLTTAMTDYHIPASQAADITSKLIATVAAGKTNMQDLSGSLSAVLPAAASAHVGLAQILGAMGTMTGQGISAQQAAQNLAGTIRSLSNPSAVASHEMAQMGLNSTTVAQQLGSKGLTGTLEEFTTAITKHMGPAGLVLQSSFNQSKLAAQSANQMLTQLPKSLQGLAKEYLNNQVTAKTWSAALKGQDALTANLGKQFATVAKHAHGFSDTLKAGGGAAQTYNAALSNMTGGATGLNTALALSGANAGTFAGNVSTIGKSATEAGGHVKGWATTQKDLKTQIDQAKAGIEAMGTKIGMALIPWVQKAITVGTTWVNYLQQHKPLMLTIAAVVGTVLVGAITAYVASLVVAGVSSLVAFASMAAGALAWGASMLAAGAMAILPFLPIIVAVGLVALAAYELYKHWNTVWGFIKKIALDAWHWAEDIFHNKFTQILIGITMPLLFLALHWKQVWSDVQAVALGAWHFLDNNVLHPIIGGFNNLVGFIKGIPGAISAVASGMFNGIWNAFKQVVNWIIGGWDALHFGIPSFDTHIPGVGKVGGFDIGVPQIPYLAGGGQLNLAGWNVVGENGAELVGPGGRVHSNRDSAKILNSGSSPRGGTAGGGGNTYVFAPQIAGTVIAENQLQNLMQEFFLRAGTRRGIAYQQNPKAG
jgi:TP901 family phage tail tape measure protein